LKPAAVKVAALSDIAFSTPTTDVLAALMSDTTA